jgi:hypothetical protein
MAQLPFDKGAVLHGLKDGFKRVNVKKALSDVKDEYKSYIGGYVVGFGAKVIVIAIAAKYGISLV